MKRILTALAFFIPLTAFADDQATAYKIAGKSVSLSEVYKADEAAFYDLELKKYQLIEQRAQEAYLNQFWTELAKTAGTDAEAAKKNFLEKETKISDKEVKETVEKYKDNPQLKALSKDKQAEQVRGYLRSRAEQEIVGALISTAAREGKLQVVYPKPKEPIYDVKVSDRDLVRYGPSPDDIKPVACKSDDCPITIVEYSEFQCPFCGKAQPAAKRVLADYKGKVRWVVRDFPLSFHDRARPAAVAAHCAADQKLYWQMYEALFNNQTALSDKDLEKHAAGIKGLDVGKWKACIAKPASKEQIIETNFASGSKLGVTGTPAFFINGRRLSGAMPFEEFKRVIDEELARGKNP